MAHRLTRAAEDRIDATLLESARVHGIEAAGRYGLPILAAMASLGDDPHSPGSREVLRLSGIRAYPIRLSRMRVESARRVRVPRHIIVYRVAADGVVEIPGLVHDRMVLSRAACRAVEDAGEP